MRVLVINHSPLIGSGSGIYTMNVAKALKRAGQEVKVITAANSLTLPDMEDVDVRAIHFKNNYEIEGQLSFNVPCFDQYPTSDVLFYNMTKEQMDDYKNEFRRVLEEEITRFKPDIIHTQHLWIWSSIVADYDIPMVVTSHGSDMMGYDIDNSFAPYCKKAINGAKKIITISKINNDTVIDRFPEAKDKTITLKNGYDSETFKLEKHDRKAALNRINVNKDYEKIVLYAGRLTENKGIDVLLKAASRYEDGKTLTIITGGGGLLDTLKRQAKELELNDIVFTGSQSQEELNELYNVSDVTAVPSRVEGFGLVAIESLACGTPVVASRCGMTDFINDKVGAIVDIEDDIGLENEIRKILNRERVFRREDLAQYAKNNYSQDVVIERLINLYKEIIDDN